MLCGQCCVAMLLNIQLDEAIGLIGHTNGTATKELISAIRRGGGRCDDRLIHGKPCGRSLVKLNRPGRRSGNWHWVVYNCGIWHDPTYEEPGVLGVGDPTSHLMVF